MEYDFAKKFASGKLSEDRFLGELMKKIRTDKDFRAKTGIMSLETQDLAQVVHALRQQHPKSRRSFLRTAAMTAGAVASTGTKAFSQERIDPRKLFDEILRNRYFQPARVARVSNNPQAITIILVEDVHGSWSIEYAQLLLLYKKFGLNFVGIEGWAGSEVDRIRGAIMLNAEKVLIEVLLKNKNFRLIGLEDENAQRWNYFVILEDFYNRLDSGIQSFRELMENYEVPNNKIEIILDHFYNSFRRFDFTDSFRDYSDELAENHNKNFTDFVHKNTGIKTSEEIDRELEEINRVNRYVLDTANQLQAGMDNARTEEEINEIMGRFEKLQEISSRSGDRLDRLNNYIIRNISLEANLLLISQLIQLIFESIWMALKLKKNTRENLERSREEVKKMMPHLQRATPQGVSMDDYFAIHLRNQKGVQRMIQAMQQHRQKIGIVVFGRGHTPGLLQEFARQTNNIVNIIVLEKPG